MTSLASVTVLLVEDEALIRLDMEDILRALGATVVAAETAQRARAVVAETTVHAAVLDILVADGDTYELARELRGRCIKVLFVTGIPLSIPPDLARCPVVEKPFAGDALGRAVIAALLAIGE